MDTADKITALQDRFVTEYILDPAHQTQAAIRAGYSAKTAAAAASRLLKDVKIQRLIKQREARRAARTFVTPEWIMETTAQIAQSQNEKTADRLKALDMLCKMNHMYDVIKTEDDKTIRVVFGEAEDWSV